MKNKIKVLLFITMFALSTVLVMNNQVIQVSGSGGTVSIESPLSAYDWDQNYNITWIVDADSGYKINYVYLTKPNVNDTDHDLLLDGEEVYNYSTNPQS